MIYIEILYLFVLTVNIIGSFSKNNKARILNIIGTVVMILAGIDYILR